MIAPCLYGSLLLVAGLLALYLPETNNKPLPVTIEQAIAIHSKRYQLGFVSEQIQVRWSEKIVS